MKKIIVSTFVVVILTFFLCVSAYAAGSDIIVGWLYDMVSGSLSQSTAMAMYKDHWATSAPTSSSNTVRVSYEQMASAVMALNEAGQPCQLVYSSAISGWVIRSTGTYEMPNSGLTWASNGYYYVNDDVSGAAGRRAYYYCNHIDSDVLYAIGGYVDGVESRLDDIFSRLGTSEKSWGQWIYERLDTMRAYLGTTNGTSWGQYNFERLGDVRDNYLSNMVSNLDNISASLTTNLYEKMQGSYNGTTYNIGTLSRLQLDRLDAILAAIPSSSGGGGTSVNTTVVAPLTNTAIANLNTDFNTNFDALLDVQADITGYLENLTDVVTNLDIDAEIDASTNITIINEVQSYSDDVDDGIGFASQLLPFIRSFFKVSQSASISDARRYVNSWGSD